MRGTGGWSINRGEFTANVFVPSPDFIWRVGCFFGCGFTHSDSRSFFCFYWLISLMARLIILLNLLAK
jgi:hypothetical protein